MTIPSPLHFDNRYAALGPAYGTRQPPQPLAEPRLAAFNPSVAEQIGLTAEPAASHAGSHSTAADTPDRAALTAWLGGSNIPAGAEPVAMKYAGHQFGVYNPELGDGRGLLLGEVLHPRHGRWDLHIKGAGRTPYSRFGDGRAVLRSCIREYLASEAVAALGIPSTRALGIVDSSTPVHRERTEHGATLLRVARTHIRFGHFEWFHYRGETERVRELADFCIELYFPEWREEPDRYRLLLSEICRRTARLIAAWQAYGFAHGVLNTDNMSILGETFDYGPFAFMDDFEPGLICNHSDHGGRYAFNRQPGIGLWNLNALAHAFSSLLEADTLRAVLSEYEPGLLGEFSRLIRGRLGLGGQEDGDDELINQLFSLLAEERRDLTLFFRMLSDRDRNDALEQTVNGSVVLQDWLQRYRQRLQRDPLEAARRGAAMRAVNPKYLLRNYLAQRAIERAEAGDYSEIDRLLSLVQAPFEDHPDHEAYATAPPESGKHLSISCSS